MNSLCRTIAISCLAAVVSGCGFWGSNGDEIESAKLVDFSPEKQVKVLWSASIGSLGSKFHQMQPAVTDKRVFVADAEGTLAAFDKTSGEQLWRIELETALIGGVGANFGKVAVATEAGEVITFDAEDGVELWRANVRSEVSSAAQFNPDLAVFQLINGKVMAFDAITGQHRWTYDSQVPRLTLRGTSSPIVASDVTFAGFASGKLVAIDNTKGSAIWDKRVAIPEGRSELERMVDIDGRPLLVDRTLYVTSYQGRLVAINPFRAQVVWAQDVSSYHSLAAGFGNIYVSEADDAIQAFDQATSASVWRQDKLSHRGITAPAAIGTAVAVGDKEGYIHFMSQIDGHFIARHKVDTSGLTGDLVAKDDVLYVLANSGRLVALGLE